jgi:uncharacterized protein
MARVSRDAVLADVATEVLTLGDGGRSIQGGIEQTFAELASDEDEDESEDGL